jgi:molybdopterin molybdotransferase
LPCIGEIKAGDTLNQELPDESCIQIMTGAPVPSGADAVVMMEHTTRTGDMVRFDNTVLAAQNIVPRGMEARSGQAILKSGTRLGFAELALAAQVGRTELTCTRKPTIAILSTGNEIVPLEQTPEIFQIRDSNSVALAALVRLAGGTPLVLDHARDDLDDLRQKISLGLKHDALIISGGVSMGKYDLVESALKDLGAVLHFEAVAIRPGKPTVFAMCNGRPVFGLPGNPVSTMVTFQLFVSAAIDALNGLQASSLPILDAVTLERLQEKSSLTHFLPARLTWRETTPEVRALPWQGSGDIVALANANCFVIVPGGIPAIEPGEHVHVLLRKEMI